MLHRSFSSQRFLITGASGQIGQKLIPYMQSRYKTSEIIVSDLRHVVYSCENQPCFHKIDITVPCT
jgi:threonine 3-dehydrogenase